MPSKKVSASKRSSKKTVKASREPRQGADRLHISKASVAANATSTVAPGRRVTIKNVAEAAGVSIATVSFVLNKRPGQVISEPVRKRVLAAARDLSYAPSAAAAGLARKATSNVAIAFYRNDHQITNQLYSFVVQGAIKEAAEREYNVLFSFLHDEFRDYDDLPKIIREKNAEGVLFVQNVSGLLYREMRDRGVHVVAVDSHPAVPGLDTVYVDNKAGGRLSARHLVDLGHEDIVFLRAVSDRPSIAERCAGFQEELASAGLSIPTSRLFVDSKTFTFDGAYERAKKLLAQRPTVTAIAAANDELAAGVIRAAHERGRRVPEDLSVIGFDDIIMSNYLDPPLSSVSYDKEQMGRVAMGRLIEQVTAKVEVSTDQGTKIELPVWITERESTGPAPRKKTKRSRLG